jgi:hypothetical protein
MALLGLSALGGGTKLWPDTGYTAMIGANGQDATASGDARASLLLTLAQ